MNKYLLCYEVGITGGTVNGSIFVTMNGLTESNLNKVCDDILEDLKKTRSQYDYQNVVWRSVNRLDA